MLRNLAFLLDEKGNFSCIIFTNLDKIDLIWFNMYNIFLQLFHVFHHHYTLKQATEDAQLHIYRDQAKYAFCVL